MPSRNKKQDRLLDERCKLADQLDIMPKFKPIVDSIFKDEHRIYYAKKGRYATFTCSLKDETKKIRIDYPERIEDMAQAFYEATFSHNQLGECPICHGKGKFIAIGKRKSHGNDRRVFEKLTIQKVNEKEVLIRDFICSATWDFNSDDNDCCFQKNIIEKARIWLRPYSINKDFHKWDYFGDGEFWDYKNLAGLCNIQIGYKCEVYFTENLKGTFLEHHIYTPNIGVPFIDYLITFSMCPQIESIQKLGMSALADDILKGYCKISKSNEKSLWSVLGVTKERFKYIQTRNLGREALAVFRIENIDGTRYPDEYIEFLKSAQFPIIPESIRKVIHPIKFMNYIKGQQHLLHITNKLIVHKYVDYFSMKRDAGYDMANSVYMYPKNLQKAHEKIILECETREKKAAADKANKKYKEIAKKYNALNKQFKWMKDNYSIRPAKSASELVYEGARLHHCVGQDAQGYMRNHNIGKTIILLLRKIDSAEIPFCTIEIDPRTFEIKQWYQAYDKQTDRGFINSWLDAYIEHLKDEKSKKKPKVLNMQIDQQKAV